MLELRPRPSSRAKQRIADKKVDHLIKPMLQEQLSGIGNRLICPTALIVRDGKILMGLRNYTPDKWKLISAWTTPGGRCDESETVENTLRREVQEELGITDLEITDFIGETRGAKEGDIVPIFFCKTNQEIKLMEPEKFSEWRWVPIEEYLTGGPGEKPMNSWARKLISEYLRKLTK